VAEPQKQNLATSRTKGDASIVENKATWHVYAQRGNISIQSRIKMDRSFLLKRSIPIVHNTVNQDMISQSLIIIKDSGNQISNHLNLAIIHRDVSLLLKKLEKKKTRMKDTKRAMNHPLWQPVLLNFLTIRKKNGFKNWIVWISIFRGPIVLGNAEGLIPQCHLQI